MKIHYLKSLLPITLLSIVGCEEPLGERIKFPDPVIDDEVVYTPNAEVQEEQNVKIEAVVSSETTNSSLKVVVRDANGDLIQGVRIVVAEEEIIAQDGYITFENLELNQDFVGVHLSKEGFISTIKNITPSTSGENVLEVTLFAPETKTVEAAEGGLIQFDSEVAIDFPENAFVDADGNVYTGDVEVQTYYHHPENEDYAESLPGALVGLDEAGELSALVTEGMLTVDLQTPSGETIEVNGTVSVQVKMPASNQSPDQILLWHLNEDYGIWVEEGVATKVGEFYEFEVTHFSTYNLDYKVDSLSEINFTVEDITGNIMPAQRLQVFHEGTVIKNITTDADGKFSLLRAPSGSYELRPFICDGQVESTPITITSAGAYTFSVADYSHLTEGSGTITLEGTFENCNGGMPRGSTHAVDITIQRGTPDEMHFSTELETDWQDKYRFTFPVCGVNLPEHISVEISHGDRRYDMDYDYVRYREDTYVIDPDFSCVDQTDRISVDKELYDLLCPTFSCLITPETALTYESLELKNLQDLDFITFIYLLDLHQIVTYFQNIHTLEIDLTETHIIGIESLQGLSKLENLVIRNFPYHKSDDYRDLGNLIGLKSLSFSMYRGDDGIDIDFIGNLIDLESLELDLGSLDDLSPLASCTKLTDLSVSGSRDFTNIASLPSLPNLTILDLSSTNVASLEGMGALPSLGVLNLYNAGEFTDLASIPTTVKDLNLSYRDNNDISGLENLTNLEKLDLQGNGITQAQIDVLQAALPTTEISF